MLVVIRYFEILLLCLSISNQFGYFVSQLQEAEHLLLDVSLIFLNIHSFFSLASPMHKPQLKQLAPFYISIHCHHLFVILKHKS